MVPTEMIASGGHKENIVVRHILRDSFCNWKCVTIAGTVTTGLDSNNIKKAPTNSGNKEHRLPSG